MMQIIKKHWQIIKESVADFRKHRALKLSASLAFYTIFSLGPLMIVIMFISKVFMGRHAIEGTIHSQIRAFVGNTAALSIQNTIKNAAINHSDFMAVISSIILVIAATSVFSEIQSSINIIWNLKVISGRGWRQMLKKRLLSFVLIAGLGILLLLSLLVNGLLEGFKSNLQELFPDISFVLVYTANILLTLLIVACLFAVIYKVMPYAVVRWKDVIAGAFFTAILFMIGKFCITIYIDNNSMDNTYSATGSLVILLLWIYFSSIMLYFGAVVTKIFALKNGAIIKPYKYVVIINTTEKEYTENSLQPDKS